MGFWTWAYRTKSWRDVVQVTAEDIARTTLDFEAKVVSQFPKWFSRSELERARQLSNGWWIYVNFSAGDAQWFAERMVEMAEIPKEQFEPIW